MILPACLVALVSLASRRWGLKVGGIIGSFPVSVGPILFFFAIEQGGDFAVRAALRSLWGLLPFGLFCLAFSWASLRLPLMLSMALSWMVFLLASWMGLQSEIHLGPTILLAAISALATHFTLPGDTESSPPSRVTPSKWDLPLRMAVTAFMVLAVTGAARVLGPEWSGVLAAFPIATTTLAGFAYFSDGPRGSTALLRGSMLGASSYAAFCAVLAFSLPRFHLGISFLAAFFAAVAAQIAVLSLSRTKR